MIRVFGITDKLYSSNGDVVINPLKAVIHKEDNGPFYLDLETDLSYIDYLDDGNILVADTPTGPQPFRISGFTKNKSKIKIRAYHIFYDSQNYLIRDSYVVDKNCNAALDHLNSATEPESPFLTVSNVSTVASFRCVRHSLYEAIQTVIERWGGHLVRDHWTIGIYDSIGADNGVTIRYAKNLKDISCETDWTNVVTKLLPVGRDGILLPEVYITSEVQYDIPYTKKVSFTQNVNQEDYMNEQGQLDEQAYHDALIAELRQLAKTYIDTNCVPKVNYQLKANIEKITDIGDTIEVIDERLGINLMTNLISYDYDCVLKKYISVEFGNFQQSIRGFAEAINSQTREIVTEETNTVRVTLSNELAVATDKIWSTLGNSYVIYDGDKILVVDRLPKEEANNVMVINAGGIGFSTNGILGPFNSAWTIDGTMDMGQINVVNLSASLIRGGILKLGSNLNESGILELYDTDNNLIGLMDKDGLKMYGQDGSYVLMNQRVGFAGFDRNGNKTYWVDGEQFHMRKGVVEEEITFANRMRFIPITIYSGSSMVNDGIGLVSVSSDSGDLPGYDLFVPSGSTGLADSNNNDFYVVA